MGGSLRSKDRFWGFRVSGFRGLGFRVYGFKGFGKYGALHGSSGHSPSNLGGFQPSGVLQLELQKALLPLEGSSLLPCRFLG